MGLWWCPEDEERVFPRVGGTGSISTLHEPVKREARGPLGFAPPKPALAIRHDWGEADWVARDVT